MKNNQDYRDDQQMLEPELVMKRRMRKLWIHQLLRQWKRKKVWQKMK